MKPIYFKRDLQQLHSRTTLTFWYTCFNILLYYLISSLFLSIFIHSDSLNALLLKLISSLVFTIIITLFTLKRFKSIFYISPYACIKFSDSTLQYINPSHLDSLNIIEKNISYAPLDYTPTSSNNVEILFSNLIQVSFFTDCLSPTPYSIVVKTDSLTLSIDGFENMQQITQYITDAAPPDCKIKWQNTFFPALHIPSLIIFTVYLFLLDLLITFITSAFYLLIIIVPLSFGLFHLIEALFAQQKSVSWHITHLTTSIIFAFLALAPILVGLAIHFYK